MDDMLVHGTAVKLNNKGLLIKGCSGSGKSDLALRLINEGAVLISDDQVIVKQVGECVEMAPPKQLQGLLEVRGIGIIKVPYDARCHLEMIVELRARGDIDRLPEAEIEEYFGVSLPKIRLHAFDHSTPLKIDLMLNGKYPVVTIDED